MELPPFAFVFAAGVVGYFLGRRDWKRIADEAAKVAGEAILLVESYKEQLEEYEKQ